MTAKKQTITKEEFDETLKAIHEDGGTPNPLVGAPPAPPKEKLLALRALLPFTDGNLAEHFAKYGYGVDWKMNEVRHIPLWLAKRAEQSGAEFERADG